MKLYNYWRSSCSWRVRWALNIKNIPYENKIINILKGEQKATDFLSENPFGYIPMLKTESMSLGESLAIMEWLEETHPSPNLLPLAPAERARVRQVCLSITAGIQPLQNLSVMKKVSENAEVQQEFARHWIQVGLERLELALIQWGCSSTYTFGDQITMADLCLIPQIFNAKRFSCKLERFPTLMGIYDRCLLTNACQKAHPDQQPDAL